MVGWTGTDGRGQAWTGMDRHGQAWTGMDWHGLGLLRGAGSFGSHGMRIGFGRGNYEFPMTGAEAVSHIHVDAERGCLDRRDEGQSNRSRDRQDGAWLEPDQIPRAVPRTRAWKRRIPAMRNATVRAQALAQACQKT